MKTKVKLCECGCGNPTLIALVNSKAKGMVKGQPNKFIHGHTGGKSESPHALTNIDIDKNTATCVLCGSVKVYRGPSGIGYMCASYNNKKTREHFAKNQKVQNEKGRKQRLWVLYRLKFEEWETILKYQGGVCAITGKPAKKVRLSTDHDHHTGLIRGLLSLRANRGLAYFNDDPALLRRAAEYLENPPAILALGKKVFGVIGQGRHKKKMIYGSENGPLKPEKKVRKCKR